MREERSRTTSYCHLGILDFAFPQRIRWPQAYRTFVLPARQMGAAMRVEISVREFCHVLRANALDDPNESVVLLLRILDWFIERDPTDQEFRHLLSARIGDRDPLKETSRNVCAYVLSEWRARDLTLPAMERARVARARTQSLATVPYADRVSLDRWSRRQRRGV